MSGAAEARPLLASRLARTGAVFLVLLALAVLQARLLGLEGAPPPPRTMLFGIPYLILLFNTIWAALYPVIDWLAVRLLARRRALALAQHVAAAVLFALAHVGMLYLATQAFGRLGLRLYWPGKDTFFRLATDFGYYNGLLYALLAGAATMRELGARLRDREVRAARLDAELSKAQLDGLRLQLQPHFLFNALNTLSGYVLADPDKAVEMIASLSGLLRTSLRSQPESEASLQSEIGLVEQYLEIERLRFSDRLRVHITVDPEASACRVPSLLLLPIVENAVRHGVARQPGAGEIGIVARRTAETLEIAVTDNGPGPERGRSSGEGWGIGLGNTRERLRKAYGPRAALELGRAPDGGGQVRVVIPVDRIAVQAVEA